MTTSKILCSNNVWSVCNSMRGLLNSVISIITRGAVILSRRAKGVNNHRPFQCQRRMHRSRWSRIAVARPQIRAFAIHAQPNPSRDHISSLVLGMRMAGDLDSLLQIKTADHQPFIAYQSSAGQAGKHLHDLCPVIEKEHLLGLYRLGQICLHIIRFSWLAQYELLHHILGQLIGELHRRMLHGVGRYGQ